MDKKLDFGQLSDVAEYLEVTDIELFIDSLIVLKRYNDEHNRSHAS